MRPRCFATQGPDAAADLVPLIAEGTGGSTWTVADIQRLQRPRGFVLTDLGRREAVALVSLAADEAEILDIGVVPHRRRWGIGRQLLEAACRLSAQSGAARIFLEVATDNSPARALYAAAGFVEAGRRPGYYPRPGGARCDALILRRPLAGPEPSR